MDVTRISTQTLRRKKNLRKMHMIGCALDLFRSQGIEATSLNEVAHVSSLSIASVFRYIENKHLLVIASATLLWEKLYIDVKQSLPPNFNDHNGLEQVAILLSVFKSFYINDASIFRFIEEFDTYVITHNIQRNMLVDYEAKVLAFKPLFMQSLDLGKHDGSINGALDSLLLYYTITHQLFALIAKLVTRGQILDSDMLVAKEAQLECVIQMILVYLSHPKP